MQLAKSGNIANVCLPNAILTFQEYLIDYASPATRKIGKKTISKFLEKIPNEKIKKLTINNLERIKKGERDLYF